MAFKKNGAFYFGLYMVLYIFVSFDQSSFEGITSVLSENLPLDVHDVNITQYSTDLSRMMTPLGTVVGGPIYAVAAHGCQINWRILITLSSFVWAGSSVLSAASMIYDHYIAARFFVGMGQAGVVTLLPAMLSECVEASSLTIMLGAFFLAIPFGNGVGVAVAEIGFNLINDEGWRYAIGIIPVAIIFSAIGFIYSLIVHKPQAPKKTIYMVKDVSFLMTTPSFILLVFAQAAVVFSIGTLPVFSPAYAFTGDQVAKGMNLTFVNVEDYTSLFFAMTAVAGIIGIPAYSAISSTLKSNGYDRCDPIIAGSSLAIGGIIACAGLPLATVSYPAYLIFVTFGLLGVHSVYALSLDIMMNLLPSDLFNLAMAFVVPFSYVGAAFGPFLMKLIVEAYAGGDRMTFNSYLAGNRFGLILLYLAQMTGGLLMGAIFYTIYDDKKRAAIYSQNLPKVGGPNIPMTTRPNVAPRPTNVRPNVGQNLPPPNVARPNVGQNLPPPNVARPNVRPNQPQNMPPNMGRK